MPPRMTAQRPLAHDGYVEPQKSPTTTLGSRLPSKALTETLGGGWGMVGLTGRSGNGAQPSAGRRDRSDSFEQQGRGESGA